MTTGFRLTVCLLALVVTACKEGPATVGEVRNFAAVCDEANNGKRIAVTGYLQLPTTVKKRDEDVAVTLWLYETNTFKGLPIRVAVASGSAPNHLEKLPTTYSRDDMKVHLANGHVVGYGTPVKVSGTVYTPTVKQENFKCGLTNPLFELAN